MCNSFRAEVIAALKQLHSGVYRFPGGNFVSAHEWRNAIGDPDKRPPIMDPVWHAVQPNDVGTDEFVMLCRLLDVEPYVTVNAGFGDAWSAAQLVGIREWRDHHADRENGAPQTAIRSLTRSGSGALATSLGAIIKWAPWRLINELKHNLFAKAMRKVDPSIKLIAGGAMPNVISQRR